MGAGLSPDEFLEPDSAIGMWGGDMVLPIWTPLSTSVKLEKEYHQYGQVNWCGHYGKHYKCFSNN